MPHATSDPVPPTVVRSGLDDAYRRARDDGVIQVVNLVGREGAGKSAQVDAWVEEAAPQLVLRCWFPYEAAATFRPLADLIELAAGIEAPDSDDDVREKLLALGAFDPEVVSRLTHVVGVRGRVYPNHEIFWATQFFLEALGQIEPVVVVVEGAERAEEVFLDMLEYLAGRPGRALVVSTARPRLLRTRPHWKSEELTASLNALTIEGPAFAERAWFSALASLNASERAVIDCASIVGDAFSLDALDALTSSEGLDATPVIVERLVGAGLLRRRAGTSENIVTFELGALRDLVHEELPERFAARAHERLASFLEKRSPGRFGHEELVAFHLEAALEYGDRATRKRLVARAVPHLALAGRRALARSDAPAAADLLERGAVLISEQDTRRPRLLLDLCDALLDLGDTHRLARIADAGLKEAVDSENEIAAARFGVWTQIARARLGQDLEAADVDEDERVASLLEAAGEHLGAAQVHQLHAEHLWDRLDYLGAERSLEKALANAHSAGYLRLEAKAAAWLLFSIFWGPRPAMEGVIRCRSFAGRFDDDRLLEANRLTTLGGLLGLGGDFAPAREHVLQGRAIQSELGQPLVISWNPQIGGTVALLAGDLELAEAEFRIGFEEAQSLADPGHAATTASLLAKSLYEQGRLDPALKFTRLAEQAAFGGPEAAQAEWRCTRAKIEARRGEVEAAEATILSALQLLDDRAMPRDRADALVDLAEVRRLGSRPEDERDALREALGLYEIKGVVPAAARVRERLDELRELA